MAYGLRAALRRLMGRRAMPARQDPTPPKLMNRPLDVPDDYPVRVGDEAVRRIVASSRRRDPLELHADEDCVATGMAHDRVELVIRAALHGDIPIDPRHARDWLHPVTEAMLTMARIEPDAFAVLSAMKIGGGLYIDDPAGRTLVKSIPSLEMDGDEGSHIRVRVPAWRTRPAMTWWQEHDGTALLAIPRLPDTVSGLLVGRALGDIMTDPAPGRHDLVVAEVTEDEIEEIGQATLLRLRSASIENGS